MPSHYSPETVKYTKEICNYIWDTYGRFPAHTDAFHAPGIWLQFSHLEMEYYQKFYNPELFARQQQHRDDVGRGVGLVIALLKGEGGRLRGKRIPFFCTPHPALRATISLQERGFPRIQTTVYGGLNSGIPACIPAIQRRA